MSSRFDRRGLISPSLASLRVCVRMRVRVHACTCVLVSQCPNPYVRRHAKMHAPFCDQLPPRAQHAELSRRQKRPGAGSSARPARVFEAPRAAEQVRRSRSRSRRKIRDVVAPKPARLSRGRRSISSGCDSGGEDDVTKESWPHGRRSLERKESLIRNPMWRITARLERVW